MGFFSSFLDRSGGGGAAGDEEDDGAAVFFNPGMGSGRGAGRLLVPGMRSDGLAAGCGAGAGDFFSGGGCGGDGLGSLWIGGGGDGLGSLLIGGGGGLGSVWLGGGLGSRHRASRDCASASFISAVSSCGGGHHRDHNYHHHRERGKETREGEKESGRTRDW